MQVQTKIDELKAYIPYEFAPVSKQTLVEPYDFYRAIEYAIRRMCKAARLFEKTVFIPISDNKRYYEVSNLSLYTNDKIELVKGLNLAFICPSDSQTFQADNANNNYNAIGSINTKFLEELENNAYSNFDLFYIAQRAFGSATAIFKSNSTIDVALAGEYDSISGITGAEVIELSSLEDLEVDSILTNLSKSDSGELFQSKVVLNNGSGSYSLANDVESWGWVAGDKIYASATLPTFMVFTFQALPSINYFTALTDNIPIPDQFLDDIEHFAVRDLVAKLAARDPQNAKIFQGVLSTGRIKDENTVLVDIKSRASKIAKGVVKSYNIYGFDNSDYGSSNIFLFSNGK